MGKYNLRKLVILSSYEGDTFIDDVENAAVFNRFRNDPDVTVLIVSSRIHLKWALKDLVGRGETFHSLLIDTHGHDGAFYAGSDAIGASFMENHTEVSALFPLYTKCYLAGCDIGGEDDDEKKMQHGKDFLRAIGESWLRLGGGEVSAWSSEGLTLPIFGPFFGGHTMHWIGSHLFTAYFGPGGIFLRIVERKSG